MFDSDSEVPKLPVEAGSRRLRSHTGLREYYGARSLVRRPDSSSESELKTAVVGRETVGTTRLSRLEWIPGPTRGVDRECGWSVQPKSRNAPVVFFRVEVGTNPVGTLGIGELGSLVQNQGRALEGAKDTEH